MPFYAVNPGGQTVNTISTDLVTVQTVVNQPKCWIVGIHGCMAGSTVGGCRLELDRMSSGVSTGGTPFTPAQRDPNSITEQASVKTLPAIGTGLIQQVIVGLPQTGGHGAWLGFHLDHEVLLLPNGGLQGNVDLIALPLTTATPMDYTLELFEG